jgi:hypothetical protein
MEKCWGSCILFEALLSYIISDPKLSKAGVSTISQVHASMLLLQKLGNLKNV